MEISILVFVDPFAYYHDDVTMNRTTGGDHQSTFNPFPTQYSCNDVSVTVSNVYYARTDPAKLTIITIGVFPILRRPLLKYFYHGLGNI